MLLTFDNNDNYYHCPIHTNIDYNCNLVKTNHKKITRTHQKSDYIEKRLFLLNKKRINRNVSNKIKRNRINKQNDIIN